MPHPYVKNVAFIGGNIVLAIQVDEYPVGEILEITGYATQNGGAFAVFNDIQPVRERNPDGTDFMYVKALPSPPPDFKKGHDVTVVLRAARVWTTVLGEPPSESASPAGDRLPPPSDQSESADEGTTWSDLKAVTYAAPLSAGNTGQTYTEADSNFQHGT